MARKNAPSRKPKAPGRSRAKEASFEVEDQAAAAEPAGPAATLETGLVFVTFIALLVGLLLSQIELSSSFGRGLF